MGKILVVLMLFLFCASSCSAAELAARWDVHPEFIECGPSTFKAPHQFPYLMKKEKGELYLRTDTSSCDKGAIEFQLSLSEECEGQNVCSVGSLAISEVNPAIADKLEEGFAATADTVELSKIIMGYYTPSQCFTYCNEAKVIWFDEGRIYIMGSKTSKGEKADLQEFKKAAMAYIQSEYAH